MVNLFQDKTKRFPNMITKQISQKDWSIEKPFDTKRLLWILSAAFIFIVSLNIFQDFMESIRSGYSFYFSESILFKTIWFLFIPILGILYKTLINENLDSFYKTAFFIIVPIIIHFIILPFVVLFFSVLFYEGRYDLYKCLLIPWPTISINSY